MKRQGVTLIELLIALAITALMMGAVVTLFANMTQSVTDSRSVIEISERLRAARNLLQNDLVWHTAPATPPLNPAVDQGFIELIEGQIYSDNGFVAATGSPTVPLFYTSAGMTVSGSLTGTVREIYTSASPGSILGDVDDIVQLTVHSNDKPFTGIVNGVMMESQNAEIIWFALPNGRLLTNKDGSTTQLWTLYRRVLLVLPGLNLQALGLGTVPSIFANNDISAHTDWITNQTVSNSLGDLTKRENRFYHGQATNPPANFPFQLNRVNLPSAILTGARLGQDVVLDNVLAFDMRVYDPLAAMVPGTDGTLLGPCDVGYSQTGVTNLATLAAKGGMTGGFVDMAYAEYGTNFAPQLRNPFVFWNVKGYFAIGAGAVAYSKMTLPGYATYDSWSLSYEHDGIDQDGSGTADQGYNGFDDNAGPGPYFGPNPSWLAVNGIVDDPPAFAVVYNTASPGTSNPSVGATPGERETMSPFPFPLQAVEVKIRVYESDSRQVRQVTVVQDFVPE